MKKWPIKRIDELNDDELDEFYRIAKKYVWALNVLTRNLSS